MLTFIHKFLSVEGEQFLTAYLYGRSSQTYGASCLRGEGRPMSGALIADLPTARDPKSAAPACLIACRMPVLRAPGLPIEAHSVPTGGRALKGCWNVQRLAT